MIVAALVALIVYIPIGVAAVIEERRERAWATWRAFMGEPHLFTQREIEEIKRQVRLPVRPGDHRQWKRWG